MLGMTRPFILVVEDFALLRSSVMQWLRVQFPGFHVKGVGTAEEALEHARISRPDVVLMDIDLPGINGFEATSLFRVRSPATAVVMLTMHDTPGHRQAAAAAGASGYVAKTDLEEQLGATLESLLGERARRSS
jgi:DNA-binding NarL/FixJ family response regulator